MPSMPNVVSIDYYAAELALLQAGIYVPPGYFQLSKISTNFIRASQFLFGQSGFGIGAFGGTPFAGFVTGQAPLPGTSVAKGAAINLTLMEFPMSVAFP